MASVFSIIQEIMSMIMKSVGIKTATQTTLPQTILDTIDDVEFFESISLWVSPC